MIEDWCQVCDLICCRKRTLPWAGDLSGINHKSTLTSTFFLRNGLITLQTNVCKTHLLILLVKNEQIGYLVIETIPTQKLTENYFWKFVNNVGIFLYSRTVIVKVHNSNLWIICLSRKWITRWAVYLRVHLMNQPSPKHQCSVKIPRQ